MYLEQLSGRRLNNDSLRRQVVAALPVVVVEVRRRTCSRVARCHHDERRHDDDDAAMTPAGRRRSGLGWHCGRARCEVTWDTATLRRDARRLGGGTAAASFVARLSAASRRRHGLLQRCRATAARGG